MRVFDFQFNKEEQKWKAMISGEYAFYMFTTFGFPPELLEEIVNERYTHNELSRRMLLDWIECAQSGEKDINGIQIGHKKQ
jgi:alanyl-tRNA synthetase